LNDCGYEGVECQDDAQQGVIIFRLEDYDKKLPEKVLKYTTNLQQNYDY